MATRNDLARAYEDAASDYEKVAALADRLGTDDPTGKALAEALPTYERLKLDAWDKLQRWTDYAPSR